MTLLSYFSFLIFSAAENILIKQNGVKFLCSETLCKEGFQIQCYGTPEYAAPELATASVQRGVLADPAQDIFSFGKIIQFGLSHF